MESVAFIQWCLEHLNYWTITLLMTIESSFIPFPSEVIIPPAAYKAAVNDELNIYLVVLFATIGADIGALINYYLAKWLGRPIIYKFANSRIGHMCLIDEAKVQHAESYFDKHGALSTFIGRLIPAVRQLISIPAGLARMKMHTFLLYTTIGAGLWNTILAVRSEERRVLPLDSARHRKRRTTDCQSNRIQPRNRLLLHRNRNIHRGLPGL